MRMAEARRRADELMAMVGQDFVLRQVALELVEQMFRFALPDPIVLGKDGRIIYPLEEPMQDRDDISRKEMNEFWDEQTAREPRSAWRNDWPDPKVDQQWAAQLRELADQSLKGYSKAGLSSAVAIRTHYDIQRERMAARMVERHVEPVTVGKADGRVPCPFGCDGLRVTNPNCNYHGVKGTAKDAQAEFHAAFARTAKASAQAIADKRAARTAAPAHFCGVLCVAQGCDSAPKAAPAPRTHDFSNPYLLDGGWMGPRQCVACGDRRATIDSSRSINGKTCTPVPGWREKLEAEIAVDTDHQARNRHLNRTPSPRAQPYRNDIGGIGAVMGGLHNCAPERGR